MAGYSGTPLVRKLGIKPETTLVLLREPDGFRSDAGRAAGRRARRVARRRGADLTVWFVTRRGELETGMAGVAKSMGAGLWIAWPKKASGVRST